MLTAGGGSAGIVMISFNCKNQKDRRVKENHEFSGKTYITKKEI
jgi:hypothetical protein